MPGTLDQKKIYAIRSFGLNVIIHFSNEQYDYVGKAGIWGENSKKRINLLEEFHSPAEVEITYV